MTTRRSFLGGLAGILGAGMAPAAIGSSVLMPVKRIIVPQRSVEDSLLAAMEAQCQERMAMVNEMIRWGSVVFVDTPRPGGGIDRKWIPAHQFYAR